MIQTFIEILDVQIETSAHAWMTEVCSQVYNKAVKNENNNDILKISKVDGLSIV